MTVLLISPGLKLTRCRQCRLIIRARRSVIVTPQGTARYRYRSVIASPYKAVILSPGVHVGVKALNRTVILSQRARWRENRPNKAVILSQCAHWRENPPDFQSAICRALLGCSVDFGDSHTSDIGHWFRMTGKSGRALYYLRKDDTELYPMV